MGRRPLPTAVKRARGTLQPCRTNPDEPPVHVTRPDVPPGLDAMERRAWDRYAEHLVGMRVLTVDNQSALRDLACADVRVVRARRGAAKNGPVETDPETGRSRRSAWALELDAALADLHRIRGLFGLTPSDRVKVKATTPTKQNPEEERRAAEAKRFGW